VGNFSVLLTLSNGESVDMELGRNTLAKIEEIITQTPEISPLELTEIIAGELKDQVGVEMAVAKIVSQKLHLTIKGTIGAKLIRKEKIVDLAAGQNITGPVLGDDLLIIGTDKFWQLASTKELSILGNREVTEIRDEFLPEIESLEDNAQVAALFIKINLKEDDAEEESKDEVVSSPTVKKSLGETMLDLSSKYLRRLPTPRGVYLKHHDASEPQKYRRPLYLAIVVLLCLVSVIAFQLRSKALEQRGKTVAAIEKQVAEGVDSGSKLVGVNDNIAREILSQTKKDFLSKAEASFGANWQNQRTAESAKLKAILKSLDEKIATIAHIYQVDNLGTFYDFGLLKSGVKVASAGLEKNEIFAIDPTNGAAYVVGTKNKTAAILVGADDLKSAKFIDGVENTVYAYSPNGIYKIDRGASTATAKQIIKPSEKLGEVRGLKTFADNLYLMDATNNQVWKYQATGSGFADIIPYLKSGSLDFSKVTSFAIDGFIYVLSGSGNVVRFASGYADDFKITSLPDPLVNPSSIFVSDETQNVYILDNNGARVIVVDKKGGYLAQYTLADSSKQVAGSILLADEMVKKVFLVSGDKVYSFDLR